jgi:hypothetical protein
VTLFCIQRKDNKERWCASVHRHRSGFPGAITEPFDLGKDTGSPVSPSYESPFAFTGKVEKVEVGVKP